jgi:uncharacterized protein YdeI (YjbR/CyaY-like superfamily)
MRKMIQEGKMTPAGLSRIDESLLQERPGAPVKRPSEALPVPAYLRDALMADEKARQNFNKLACSYRNLFIRWITAAQREETRNRRIREALELLARGEKLGMK